MAPILYSKLNAQNINLIANQSETAVTNFRVVYKTPNGNVPLIIQTPKMNAPFGVSNNQDIPNLKTKPELKYFLNLSFKNEENNPKLQLFRQKIKEVEERIRKLFLEQFADNLLPLDPDDPTAKHDEITLKRIFNSSIKKVKNKKGKTYPDTFRISISHDKEKTNVLKADFYDSNRMQQPYTDIRNGAEITSIIIVNLFASKGFGKFGVIMRLMQLQYENPELLDLNSFQIQDEDGDSEDNDDDNDSENLEFAIDN